MANNKAIIFSLYHSSNCSIFGSSVYLLNCYDGGDF